MKILRSTEQPKFTVTIIKNTAEQPIELGSILSSPILAPRGYSILSFDYEYDYDYDYEERVSAIPPVLIINLSQNINFYFYF